VKVTIDGTAYDFDEKHRPMSEALAIEQAWGRRYAEWESELAAGSATAMAVFVWLVWRRNGRDVKLEDILSGEVDFDYRELELSLLEGAAERQRAAEEAEANPTTGDASPAAPDGTPTTPAATRRSSRKSST
jgi:hypothetical protein